MDKQKKIAIRKLKKDIESKVKSEKEAFGKILELVGEESISEEKLISSTPWLNPDNYSDIIEERFSMKLCGYIICPNKLVNIPKHKYHISVAKKQVFDLSERKKFCCNQCYKESEFFASQLSREPIWERNLSIIPDIKIITRDRKEFNNNDKNCQNDSEKFENIKKSAVKISEKVIEVSKEEIKSKNIPEKTDPVPPSDSNSSLIQTPPLEDCCKVISVWLTNRTLDFLIKTVDNRDFFDGIPVFPQLTEQLKERISYRLSANQPSDSDDFSSDDTLSDNDELATGKYVSNSTLDKMQTIFAKHVKSPVTPKGELPSFSSLDPQNVPDIQENEDIDKPDVVLPMVDSVSQANMRCNIILAKLHSVVYVVTRSLQLIAGDFWEDMMELVKTFRLTQYNILFKKHQWEFILIILTYLISLVNVKVKTSIEDEHKHTQLITPIIEHWEEPTLLKEIAVVHP